MRLGFPGGASGKEPACQCRRHETWVWSLSQEDPLEEGMATISSILAWRIPWTEEPGSLQSTRLRRVGHNWSDLAHTDEVREYMITVSHAGEQDSRAQTGGQTQVSWPLTDSSFHASALTYLSSKAKRKPINTKDWIKHWAKPFFKKPLTWQLSCLHNMVSIKCAWPSRDLRGSIFLLFLM